MEDADQAEQAQVALAEAGFGERDLRVYTSQQILDSWQRFQAERSLAQRVAGAITDDPATIELYFGYARAGRSALWVHVFDEARRQKPCEPWSTTWSSTSATTATTASRTFTSAEASTRPGEGKTTMSTTTTGDGAGLRRVTGWLLVIGAVAFAVAATVLSSTFDWPDILREPPEVVLPAFVAGGTSLVWTWFAVAWTYAILLVPILLLPAALGRRDDPVLRAATLVGAASVLLSLIGFLRWVFVVPPWRHLRRRRPHHPGRGRGRLDGPAPVRRSVAGRAPGPAGDQLVGHRQPAGPAHRDAGPLGWLGRAGRQRAVSVEPGRHPGHRRSRLPDLGPRGLLGSTLWGLWVIGFGVAVLRARPLLNLQPRGQPRHLAPSDSRPDA